MTIQERLELLNFIQRALPTLSDTDLHSIGLACTALAHGRGEDGETPRETFDHILNMLNDPNTRALGTIACALANAQVAAQRSASAVEAGILNRVRRAES